MTNLDYLFHELVAIGQSPKEKSDTVTILEKIGHFLDEENLKIFNKYDQKFSRKEITKKIEKEINISSILKKSFKDFDGGYALSGLIGHGSSFIVRDPNGIRPRGGSWNDEPSSLLTHKRFYSDNSLQKRDPQIPKSQWWNTDAPNIGFRIVRVNKDDSESRRNMFWNN